MSTWGIILKYINLWKTQSNHGCLGMIREGSEGWRKFWGWYAGADYGGIGNEEGVLKERKTQDFRVMGVSYQGAWEPGLVGKGPPGMELNGLWVSWKSLSFSCNTQRRGLWVVSYFVLKLSFYFCNFCRNKITLTGQSFVKIQVNEMEFINFKWRQCLDCLVSIKLLCFLPFKNEDSVVFCT